MIIPEIGNLCLMFALLVSLASCMQIWKNIGLAPVKADFSQAYRLAIIWPVLTLSAFALLGYLFLVDDFSVKYILLNSNKALSPIFKLTAIWGAHEGSLLLWVAELGVWVLGVLYYVRNRLTAYEQARIYLYLNLIAAVLLAVILFASNPFVRILVISSAQGQDLNPLLQDPGMVTHPPMLYCGYVGLAVVYAGVMGMLAPGVRPQNILSLWQPLIKLTWVFLTIGITLGAAWAYRQLGWGGWWFWDPVENASLMPWLIATSLLHSMSAARRDYGMQRWVVIGGIIGFVLSILGTFLVRSGVLVSVHSFAQDPKRGLVLLTWLVAQISLSLYVFWRSPYGAMPEKISKHGMRLTLLQLNNVMLNLMLFTVALATLYPLVLQALGVGRISIGAPYFNLVMRPMLWVVLCGMLLVPYARWQSTESIKLPWFKLILIGAVLGVFLTIFWVWPGRWYGAVTCGLAFWMMISMFWAGALSSTTKQWRMRLAHTGFAWLISCLVIASHYGAEQTATIGINDIMQLAGHEIKLVAVEPFDQGNYSGHRLVFLDVYDNQFSYLKSELRYFKARDNWQSKADIGWHLGHDFMVVAGRQVSEGQWSVRLYYKPMLRLALLGILMMVVAALDSNRLYFKRQREKFKNV